MRKLIGLLVLAMSLPAYAFNYSFAEYTPTYYFIKSDWTLMEKTINAALAHGSDGQRLSWSNPDSTAFGYVTPSDTTRDNGQLCRQVKIYNSAKTVTGEASYRFCMVNGSWKAI
jgi:surface antigen